MSLSVLTFLPLVGSLGLFAIPGVQKKWIRTWAVFVSAVTFLYSIYVASQVNLDVAAFQLVERYSWIPAIGVKYFMAVDGISLAMLLLTTFLTLLAIIASLHIEERIKEYFFFFLMLETAMLGVFVSLDLFLFYVFWELTLVPMYFLIGIWGGPKKEYAAIKFFLFTLFGSVFMLIAVLALYFNSTPHTFDYTELLKQQSVWTRSFQLWVFIGFYIGFAVKIPAFPFHTWLPLAHVEAPTAVSVILAGVLLKMGTYGLLRFSFALFPVATHYFAWWLALIAMINIVYGALCSLAQSDMKRMIAYSSINHMGYALLGMAALNIEGISGAMMQMVNHGVITGCLFFLVGVIYDRAHTRDINVFGGLATKVPVFAGFMMLASFASLGLPLLAGFVGEFLCFLGGFKAFPVITSISLIGILVTAGFFLVMIRKVFLGPLNPKWNTLSDMNGRELAAVVPLAVLTVLFGVYPSLLLSPMKESLQALTTYINLPLP